jgi:predicted ABC-type ATPase
VKDVIVIGGPNGAGKTTWAYRNLAPILEIREFVNADEIAHGLSPINPEAGAIPAGRVMLNRLNDLVEAGGSFAFETTCSGLAHAPFLRRCRSAGYRITLIFLWLPSADIAIARVALAAVATGFQPTLSHADTRLVSAICATSTCRLLIWLLFTTIPTVMVYLLRNDEGRRL